MPLALTQRMLSKLLPKYGNSPYNNYELLSGLATPGPASIAAEMFDGKAEADSAQSCDTWAYETIRQAMAGRLAQKDARSLSD